MPIGPNEDGAELYRMHLESLPCPTCGTKESDRAALAAAIAERDALREAVEWAIQYLERDVFNVDEVNGLIQWMIDELRRRVKVSP